MCFVFYLCSYTLEKLSLITHRQLLCNNIEALVSDSVISLCVLLGLPARRGAILPLDQSRPILRLGFRITQSQGRPLEPFHPLDS